MNIIRLNDLSVANTKELAGPYVIDDPPFLEYLRTLGLRTFDDGSPKLAFEIVQSEAAARGFGQ